MTHALQNFDYHSGDTRPIDVEVYDKNPDDPTAALVDIATATEIIWGVRKDKAAALLFEKKLSLSQITRPAFGTFRVALLKSDTLALDGRYVHEASIVDANNVDGTVARGFVTFIWTVLQ